MKTNGAASQLDLLQPLITAEIRKLARRRLIDSENLFKGETLSVNMPKHQVKLALLLVQIMNPFEDFSLEEEALMRGVSSKTLRARKAQDRASIQSRLR
jgi:hypothetical protein